LCQHQAFSSSIVLWGMLMTTTPSASAARLPSAVGTPGEEEEEDNEHGITRLAVIDMSDPDRHRLAQRLHTICTNHGFFFLTGHGIDGALQRQALNQTRQLFDLPLGKKLALVDHELSRGYTGMQEETLDIAHQTVGDAKEGFYLAKDVSKDDEKCYNPAKLRGPNQWPDPDDLPDFEAAMSAYFQQLSAVAFRLVQLLALSLNLDEHHFDAAFTEPMAALRLLHYNAGIENSQKIVINENNGAVGIYGCGAHSDYGMITLLLTDGTPGLQIQTQQEKWRSVLEPPKHASDDADAASYYVVNLGDMLERWTNGLYKSTVHRVILQPVNDNGDDDGDNKKNLQHRYSIPFFYEPNFDTIVECLPTCVSLPDNPAKYPPTTSGQYLLDKYQQTHADFTPTTSTTTTRTLPERAAQG
jgi:isopenicillin N synthase-like dioxygenase